MVKKIYIFLASEGGARGLRTPILGDLGASPLYYEKHRAPARVPRAGVDGGSAPDAYSVINHLPQ